MNSSNDKVAVFAPYKELYDICQKCAKKENFYWDMELVNSHNVYELGEKYKNYHLIISRGEIAKTLKDLFDFEVIEIYLSKEKILEALYKYRDSDKKVAVVENREFIDSCKSVNTIIKMNLRYYTIRTIEEFPKMVHRAYMDGAKVIIGGSYGLEITETINAYGIQYELINSDMASVKEAFGRASTFLKGRRLEFEKNQLLASIIDFYPKGIVYIDKNKIIRNINNYTKEILHCEDIIGTHVSQFFEANLFEGTDGTTRNLLTSVSGQPMMVDVIDLSVDDSELGSMISFQNEKEIISMEHKIRRDHSKNGFQAKYTFDHVIGESERIKFAIKAAKIFSEIDSTVLITGETGTGKEIFAQAIHNNSSRGNENFVAINCSALPDELLESELFGYKEGAFTGSKRGGKRGLIELAHKGTLFLDEIGEMNIELQSKLLRVIAEQEIMKIGDYNVIPVDIRIIAATNKDLISEIEKGNFRRDLYYRLNVMSFQLPPLRDRKEDIGMLVKRFIQIYNGKFSNHVKGFSEELTNDIMQYYWPGNVRELKNFVEKCVAVTKSGYITKEIISIFGNSLLVYSTQEHRTLREIEKDIITELLEKNGYNKSIVAKELGIDRGTLNRKIK